MTISDQAFEVGSAKIISAMAFFRGRSLVFFSTPSMKPDSPIQESSKRLYVNLRTTIRDSLNCVPISAFPAALTPGAQSLIRELIERYLPFKKPQAETTYQNSEPVESSGHTRK